MSREDRIVVGFLLLLAAWTLVALPIIYWPESPQHQQSYPSEPPRSADYQPKGTPQAPFFIEVLPGPNAAQKAAQEAEDRLEKQQADRWLVRWTFALFAATFGLIVATGALGYFAREQMRDMRASIKVAQQSASAAEKAAEHIPLVERAWMSCGGTGEIRIEKTLSVSNHLLDHPVPTGQFAFQINNHGKTPGRLLQLSLEFCDIKKIPPAPLYNWIDHPDWIGPGTQSRTIRRIDIPQGSPHSCVYGRIRYRSIFDGRVRSSGFFQNLLENGESYPIKPPSDAYTDWD